MSVSFEFFPPKTAAAAEKLYACVEDLARLQPDFVSVTYGAGGSTKAATFETVTTIKKRMGLITMPHLTCVGAPKEEINSIVQEYLQSGVQHILALRGDMPGQVGDYVPHPKGYPFAVDLVEGLHTLDKNIRISVAAYPEGHPQAASLDADIDNLKRKQDAGAHQAITQYFFDTEAFFRFRDKAHAKGITMPIIAGILPIQNFEQVKKFSSLCGTTITPEIHALFDGLEDEYTRQLTALHVAATQAEWLAREGVDGFHFYTLNKAELPRAICHILGYRDAQQKAA
jgi:methylenetetrahydrofolate reductase (NADPH)